MNFVEETRIDQIEVLHSNHIQVREATIVLRDGEEIAKTYHRYVLAPGTDLTDQPDKVAAIANAVWTPEVVAAYAASQANNP